MIDESIFEPKDLWQQPLQRVGYSDRTAWFMAALSELAYLRFESTAVEGLLEDLATAVGRTQAEVLAAVQGLLDLAACYTLGSPKVGDRELSRVFKTPIYRVVNASDAVPRIPVGGGMWFVGKALGCAPGGARLPPSHPPRRAVRG